MLDAIEHMPTALKVLWVASWLAGATLLERLIPLSREPYHRLRHLRVNGALLASTLVINGLFGLLLVRMVPWLEQHRFGLFHLFELPIWFELLLTVLILDLLAQYVVHYLLHNVPLLWRFHMVHHSDTHVDATTGTRHHPVDYAVRETFSLVIVALLGAPIAFYLLYRLLTVVFTYLTHANIRLPGALDRALATVFVTPDAHKFHHHENHPWTDRNYGNVFSIWDRLFGTFVYDDTARIRYGVDTMVAERADALVYQLRQPFSHDAGRARASHLAAAATPGAGTD
ncbi:MAG: sterol desaturase family protein [Burkholderiaceae bacterium]